MSEKRTILSRPRTRVYDCNYNIGENYYKPMMDKLDRKYSTPTSFSSTTFSAPVFSRRLKDDNEFGFSARRLSAFSSDLEPTSERVRNKLGSETRSLEEDLEDDIVNSVRKLRTLRAAKSASVEEEFTPALLNGLPKHKRLDVDSAGVNDKLQNLLTEEILKKRTIKMPSLFDEEPASVLSNWTSLREPLTDKLVDSEASARARQTRARLAIIEREMEDVAQRGFIREKRISNLKSLLGGEDPFANAADLFQSKKSSRSSKRVTF